MKMFNDLQIVQQAKFCPTEYFHLNSLHPIYTKILQQSEISSRLVYFFMNVSILRLNLRRQYFELKYLELEVFLFQSGTFATIPSFS